MDLVVFISEHNRRFGPIVRSRGGRVVKRLGDGNVCHTGERTCFYRPLT